MQIFDIPKFLFETVEKALEKEGILFALSLYMNFKVLV